MRGYPNAGEVAIGSASRLQKTRSIWFVWFIWFVLLLDSDNPNNQINKTNQTNQINKDLGHDPTTLP